METKFHPLSLLIEWSRSIEMIKMSAEIDWDRKCTENLTCLPNRSLMTVDPLSWALTSIGKIETWISFPQRILMSVFSHVLWRRSATELLNWLQGRRLLFIVTCQCHWLLYSLLLRVMHWTAFDLANQTEAIVFHRLTWEMTKHRSTWCAWDVCVSSSWLHASFIGATHESFMCNYYSQNVWKASVKQVNHKRLTVHSVYFSFNTHWHILCALLLLLNYKRRGVMQSTGRKVVQVQRE